MMVFKSPCIGPADTTWIPCWCTSLSSARGVFLVFTIFASAHRRLDTGYLIFFSWANESDHRRETEYNELDHFTCTICHSLSGSVRYSVGLLDLPTYILGHPASSQGARHISCVFTLLLSSNSSAASMVGMFLQNSDVFCIEASQSSRSCLLFSYTSLSTSLVLIIHSGCIETYHSATCFSTLILSQLITLWSRSSIPLHSHTPPVLVRSHGIPLTIKIDCNPSPSSPVLHQSSATLRLILLLVIFMSAQQNET